MNTDHDHDHENESPLPLRPPQELKEIMAAAVEHQCFVGAAGTIMPFGPIVQGIVQGIVQAVMALSHARGGHDETLAQRAGLVGQIVGFAQGAGIEVTDERHAQIIAMDPEALSALLQTLVATGAFPSDPPHAPKTAASSPASVPPEENAQDLEQTRPAPAPGA